MDMPNKVLTLYADASKYGSDKSSEASKYGADASKTASMYGSDKTLEGTKYSADAQVRNTTETGKQTRETQKQAAGLEADKENRAQARSRAGARRY